MVVTVVVFCGAGAGAAGAVDVLLAIEIPLAISSDKESVPSQRNIVSTTATHSSFSGD